MRALLRMHRVDNQVLDLRRTCSVLLTVPFSSVDCERGFSAMKLIKTPLQNALSADNLNWALLVIESPEIQLFDFLELSRFFCSNNRKFCKNLRLNNLQTIFRNFFL